MFLISNAFFKGFNPFSGWMAGPVVFGIVVDSACQIWSASCSGQGACALYDNNDLRIKYHSYQVISKVIAVLLQVLVLINARRKTDWSSDVCSSDLSSGLRNRCRQRVSNLERLVLGSGRMRTLRQQGPAN